MFGNTVAKVTPFCVEYTIEDDRYVRYFEDRDDMFEWCAHVYCFQDCDDSVIIEHIFDDRREVRYAGWYPDMEYIFVEVFGDKREVWRGWFPDWEH